LCSHIFSFSFLCLSPPPSSTLSPYTTLFRSLRMHRPAMLCHIVTRRHDRVALRRAERDRDHILRQMLAIAHACVEALRDDVDERDRKSTRLNSSHVKISYAVFCLKKKKKEKA